MTTIRHLVEITTARRESNARSTGVPLKTFNGEPLEKQDLKDR